MKITAIEAHIVVVPALRQDATSSSQDDVIVLVHTDEGITGIGETDTGPWLAKAAIEAPGSHTMARGLKEIYLGQDPFDSAALWDRAYTATCMSGRRGAVVCAMGAIDMALWDIKGKALGKPIYKLLGGAHQPTITPYASLQPEGKTVEQYIHALVDWARRAKAAGFRAGKMECTLSGPYRHQELRGTDEQATEIVRAVREAVGKEFTLMVDVQYLWRDAHSCLRTVRNWDDLDIYFLETPLRMDNLTLACFIGVQLAAVSRVMSEVVSAPIAVQWFLLASLALWVVATLVWTGRLTGVYLRPRIDGKPG